LVVPVILEEHFIRPHHFGVFVQPLAHPGAQVDETFHPISR
jgi:hypothetical protein